MRTPATRIKTDYINDLKTCIDQKISDYNRSSGNHFKVDYHVVHCPCDPRLTNLNATQAIGASGNTVPPPPPPEPGGSGDTVSLNMPIVSGPTNTGRKIRLSMSLKKKYR